MEQEKHILVEEDFKRVTVLLQLNFEAPEGAIFSSNNLRANPAECIHEMKNNCIFIQRGRKSVILRILAKLIGLFVEKHQEKISQSRLFLYGDTTFRYAGTYTLI